MSVIRVRPFDDGCYFYHRSATPRCEFYEPPEPCDWCADDGKKQKVEHTTGYRIHSSDDPRCEFHDPTFKP